MTLEEITLGINKWFKISVIYTRQMLLEGIIKFPLCSELFKRNSYMYDVFKRLYNDKI